LLFQLFCLALVDARVIQSNLPRLFIGTTVCLQKQCSG